MLRRRWSWESTVARWECRCALTAAGGQALHDCPLCRLSNKAISARSKPAYCCRPANESKLRPGNRSVVRRFLVTCLGEADEIFRRLYAQLRELGWLDPDHTVVVIVGDRKSTRLNSSHLGISY